MYFVYYTCQNQNVFSDKRCNQSTYISPVMLTELSDDRKLL